MVRGGGPVRPALGPALELAGLGIGLTLTIAFMARLPSWYRELGTFQALYVVAFAFFAITLLRMTRYAALPRAGLAVMAVAVATRVALLPVAPSLSADVNRYVWEGRVLVAGENPYALPPNAPELEHLRDRDVYPGINHKELATIYPPLAQAGFALVAAVSPTVMAMKVWIVLHDLALIVVLSAMLRAAGLGAVGLVAYAWNPLVLVEFAGSGHGEPTALLWLALALHLARLRPALSSLALIAGVMVKVVPIVAAPFLLRAWPARVRAAAVGGLAAVVVLFWGLTRGEASGLDAYVSRWRNNEALFLVLERALGGFDAARIGAVGVVAGACALALRKRWETLRATRLALRTSVLVGPVVHPWYLGWVLAFEPFHPSTGWLLLSLTVTLNYGVFRTPVEGRSFHLPLEWRLLEFGLPLMVALAAWGLQARRRATGGT